MKIYPITNFGYYIIVFDIYAYNPFREDNELIFMKEQSNRNYNNRITNPVKVTN